MQKLNKILIGAVVLATIGMVNADSNLNVQNYVSSTSVNNTSLPVNFVEIDTAAYASNLRNIRKMFGPEVKICIVMKADAYGHGITNLIDEAIKANVDYIAAIDNSEFRILATKIAASGKKIHLLRIAPVTQTELIEAQTNNWHVEEIAGSVEQAKMLSTTAQQLSHKLGRSIIVPIHINVETGMGRMGVRDVSDMRKIISLPNLKLVGIMTHFSKAYEESPVGETSTRRQLDVFESAVRELNLDPGVIQHVANSGAATKFPWARKGMVRIGSLTYGEELDDLQDPKHVLKPVMSSFKSTVAMIERNVPPHSPINYDGLEYTRSDRYSTTATLRIGYDYGYPQYAFKESATVLIHGQRFPVLGKTSMNMLVVDISDEKSANSIKLGDEAVLLGRQGDQVITWEQFAGKNNMGVVEQVLLIGNQAPRKVISSDQSK